jgi:hypothetical protein
VETRDELLPIAAAGAPFIWQDHSRFVSVTPVEHGWLVLWGRWHDMGRRRELAGNQTYLDLQGARRRVAGSVLELTGDPALVAEAMVRFERVPFRALPRQQGFHVSAHRTDGADRLDHHAT